MSLEDFDVQLELKERLDYTEIIEQSIKNQKEVIKSEKFTIKKLHLMIIDDLTDIPFSWYDEEFKNDIKGVVTRKKVPNVRYRAGVPLSKGFMEKHKIPLEKEIVDIDYFKLKMAIRNLLDRLNMLVRKDKIEMSTGKNLSLESLDDLIDKMDSEENEH